MSGLRKHLSPGLVVGIVALVVATTGSAVAGLKGSNSVGKDDIAKGTVGGLDLKAPKIDTTVVVTTADPDSAKEYEATAQCRSGTRVVNGGFLVAPKSEETTKHTEIASSYQDGNGWTVRWEKTPATIPADTAAATYTVQAYCIGLGQ